MMSVALLNIVPIKLFRLSVILKSVVTQKVVAPYFLPTK